MKEAPRSIFDRGEADMAQVNRGAVQPIGIDDILALVKDPAGYEARLTALRRAKEEADAAAAVAQAIAEDVVEAAEQKAASIVQDAERRLAAVVEREAIYQKRIDEFLNGEGEE
jgi:hypothetical protein